MSKGSFSTATQTILVALSLLALGIILWRTAEVVVIAFGGIVVATLLRALAHPLHRFKRLSDHARVTIALCSLLAILGALFWLFGRQVTAQADELRQLVPQQVGHIADWLNQTAWGHSLVQAMRTSARDSQALGGLGLAAITAAGATLEIILILFLGVYFAYDPIFYLEGALRIFPLNQRERVRLAMLNAGDSLRRWLLAQVVAMGIVGIMAGAMLAVLGVPLALVLGALAALFEFIPVVGAFLFGIPGIVVAFSRGPKVAVYAAIGYIAVQQLESNLIIPLLQRWAVKMPPVVGLLAVVAAGILLGPAGIVFAAPLAVVAMALINQLYVKGTLEKSRSQDPSHPIEGKTPG
jgi:predicted PurR-regulated permease PerM